MDGFFVTINCSKIFDTNEAFYKIFIRKNEMSIVYELAQWIRFMFGLEKCFFLVHENSVIHEMEDISVLEMLNSLEIRPCIRLHCIHEKMESKLFHKLNLFTHWGEIKVHKLFQARCKFMIQRVPNINCLNAQEKPGSLSLPSATNNFQMIDKSVLANGHEASISPPKLTYKFEDGRSKATESMIECGASKKYQDDINKAIAVLENENINSNEINMPKDFSSQKTLTARKNKKSKLPFSLGNLLARLREEPRHDSFGKTEKTDSEKKVGLGCSTSMETENTEDEISGLEKPAEDLNKAVFKRKRRRKHKKIRMQISSVNQTDDLSWNYYQGNEKVKPNHVRFNDEDEAMETEAAENECNSVDKDLVSLDSSEGSSGVNEQTVTAKSTFSGGKNENSENHLSEDNFYEKLMKSVENVESCNSMDDSETERKRLDDSRPCAPDLDALKQRVKHHKICLRY